MSAKERKLWALAKRLHRVGVAASRKAGWDGITWDFTELSETTKAAWYAIAQHASKLPKP